MFCEAPFCDLPFTSFTIQVVATNGEIFYFDASIQTSDGFVLEVQQSDSFASSINTSEFFISDVDKTRDFTLFLQESSGFLQIR